MEKNDFTQPPQVDEAHLDLYQFDKDLPTIKLLAALEDMADQALWNLNAFVEAAHDASYGEDSATREEQVALKAFADYAAHVKTRWPDLTNRSRLYAAEQLRQWAVQIVQNF